MENPSEATVAFMERMAGLHGIPSTIKVGPFRYTVEVTAEAIAETRYNSNSPGTTGEARPKTLHIVLDPLTPPDLKAHDLLHEVQHAIHWACGLNSDEKITVHEYIIRTTALLLAVVRENPELVAFLVEGR